MVELYWRYDTVIWYFSKLSRRHIGKVPELFAGGMREVVMKLIHVYWESNLLSCLIDVEKRLNKDNILRWWGEDRENPRGEHLSLDLALTRSRRVVHPEGFPTLTSWTWLIIYLAYFLSKTHFNQMFWSKKHLTYLPRRQKPPDVTEWRHHNLCTYAFKN